MTLDAAVRIENAVKSYGSRPVLKELCMTVERGTIYGLLGASGCGKTTLLSCIVGRKKLNSGNIWVLGGTPGKKGSGVPGPLVGYMPQDISLVAEFTVKDSIYYFGRVLGLDEELIEQQFNMFCKLFELPPQDRYIKNCSGGQQRRISLAASMVHMPKLLILDEPTVGVDPVLRESIWTYLVDVVKKENMAVIITTHYIDEAKQANKIGLMREGRLLAEESPNRLLEIFETNSLEEVFLTLSRRQEEGKLDNLPAVKDSVETKLNAVTVRHGNSESTISTISGGVGSTDILTKSDKKPKSFDTSVVNFNRVVALMDKNWKQFYRNYVGVLFLLGFPLIQTLAFLLAIGGDIKQIPLAIINDENYMSQCKNFTFEGTAVAFNSTSNCSLHNLSCRFLTYLDNPMIKKVHYEKLSEARDDISHGKVVGALFMSHNFSESLGERFNEGRFVDKEVLNFSEIKVWMDMSNRQIGQTLKYKLYTLYLDFQKAVFQDCKMLTKLSEMPVNFEEPIFGDNQESYLNFTIPGAILTIIFFMGTVMTSQIIITDRCEGIWDRSTVAGVTAVEITLTHFALQAAILVVQTAEVIILTYYFFEIKYIGSIWIIIVLTYIQGVAGMSFGFWISVISYNHSMANIVTTGSFYPMIVICGMVWPIEAMPTVLQIVSKCLPFTIGIRSLRDVTKKGWNLTQFEVLNGHLIGIVWTLLFVIVSIFLIRKKQ